MSGIYKNAIQHSMKQIKDKQIIICNFYIYKNNKKEFNNYIYKN